MDYHKGNPSVANGEEGEGKTQGLGPAHSTHLVCWALRGREVSPEATYQEPSTMPSIPYNPESMVLC